MELLLAVKLGFRSHKATGEQTANRGLAPKPADKTEQPPVKTGTTNEAPEGSRRYG
jgi:hypothetical protein